MGRDYAGDWEDGDWLQCAADGEERQDGNELTLLRLRGIRGFLQIYQGSLKSWRQSRSH